MIAQLDNFFKALYRAKTKCPLCVRYTWHRGDICDYCWWKERYG